MGKAAILLAAMLMISADAVGKEKPCPISVRFGSYCCGSEPVTQRMINDLLEEEGRNVRIRTRGHGIEGEYTRCITVKQGRLELYARLKTIADMVDPKSWPIPVVTLDGPA